MKKKFAVILLSAVLGTAMLIGCGRTDRGQGEKISHEQEDKDAVYGEVSKVTEDTITIKVGTRKEMGRSQDEGSEKPSMLDLTGEQQVIKITEETVLKRQDMRGLPGNGEVPQKPEGEQGDKSGEVPQKPERGQGDKSEEVPQKPEGEQGDKSGEMPQKPEGEPSEEAGTDQGNSSEEITVSDISEGDIVMVTFTEDKNTAEITVLSDMGGHRGDMNPPAGGQESGIGTV